MLLNPQQGAESDDGTHENRIRWLECHDKKVLLLDFSNLFPGETVNSLVEKAKSIIHVQPPKSVLTLFDATDVHFDRESMQLMKDFAATNKPYVRAGSVVGVKGLLVMFLNAVNKFAGRDLKPCNTREEALDWLTRL